MFAMNKDTMMMASIAIALVAIFLLYRDTQKMRLELQNLASDPVVVIPEPPVFIPSPVKQKKVTPPPPAPVADEAD